MFAPATLRGVAGRFSGVAVARAGQVHRRRGVRPRFLAAAVGLGLVGLGAIQLLTTTRGHVLLVRAGAERPFLRRLSVQLDVALAEQLLNMGLLRSEFETKRLVENGVSLKQVSFRTPPHLTPTRCNLWIVRAARQTGASVLRAEESHSRGGEIRIALGFGGRVTHRIVVRPPVPPPERDPARIALIIDDLGYVENTVTREIAALGVPLTLAVLPDLSHSNDTFRAAAEYNLPALLHLPMEPTGDADAGKNPLTTGMDEKDIDALVEKYQRKYPTFVGINNHMGSKATADLATMKAFAAVLERRGLFFLDSVTTPHSVAYRAARAQGVWCLRNDLFLDNETESAEAVASKLEQLVHLARRHGLAVGIAHPRPYTLQALRALVPRLQAEGIRFVTLEELHRKATTS